MGSSPHDPSPEFLRPNADFNPPPPPRVRRRRSWSYAPATYSLVAINCLVFVVMLAHHVSASSPNTDQLMYWGADNAGAVLVQGQWWRIVTAMFVHVGIIHLATNMWCLWNLGLLAEPLMGSTGLLAVYILTGAAGNLLSTFKNWWVAYPEMMELAKRYHGSVPVDEVVKVFSPGAGASGAVFGIAGALIILLNSHLLPVPREELKRLRKSVIYFAALNLVIPFFFNFGASAMHSGVRIDSMAHLGGFSCGLLFAAPMVPRIGAPRDLFLFRLRVTIAMVVGILVLFGVFLTKFAG
ncbi:MAG: rhomboid family intramembrane serine protease [Terracidiphilus sp.]